MNRSLNIIDWGQLAYPEALDRQQKLVGERLAGSSDCLILVEHPPKVTLGRRGGGTRSSSSPVISLPQTLHDLRDAGCDYLTIGQYLAPSRQHLGVVRHLPPEEFAQLDTFALGIGFKGVASGPLVRSSYQADLLVCAEMSEAETTVAVG